MIEYHKSSGTVQEKKMYQKSTYRKTRLMYDTYAGSQTEVVCGEDKIEKFAVRVAIRQESTLR